MILRRYCREDAEPLYRRMGADADLYHYLESDPFATPEETLEIVQQYIDSYDDEHFYEWIMDVDDVLVGTIGARACEDGHVGVYFSVVRAWQCRGMATIALKRVLEYLTENEGISCVTARCASENTAAKRVLEKAGMELVHVVRGGYAAGSGTYDELTYEYRSI